ncbi:MAG TPA: DNRLRE domain-containing protein [Acidimicrobiales bacterium]|nr:DNRLRE domain-containing protein [Acidimicrobiales bacterium]
MDQLISRCERGGSQGSCLRRVSTRTAAAVLLLLLTGLLAPLPAQALREPLPPEPPVPPVASVPEVPKAVPDWSMPDRTVKEGKSGYAKYIGGNRTADVPADGRYLVNLDACRSTGDITLYEWTVGTSEYLSSSLCHASVMLEEGKVPVRLTVTGPSGSHSAAFTLDVVDHLILSLGDSYASGEGNPDRAAIRKVRRFSIPETKLVKPAVWKNEACHRSAKAGPALAALALEESDPRSSVTFVHLACSGATVPNGLLGPFKGQQPQLWDAQRLTHGDKIDALTLSIGGNDIYFSSIIKQCLLAWDCPESEVHDDIRNSIRDFGGDAGPLHDVVQRALGKLSGKYDTLNGCLRTDFCPLYDAQLESVRLEPSAPLFVTAYPNITTGADGSYCDRVRNQLRRGEFRWADQVVLMGRSNTTHVLDRNNRRDSELHVAEDGVNEQVAKSSALSWTPVDSYGPFFQHGYCAGSSSWVRSLSESLHMQSNPEGAFHPNEVGHAVIGELLEEKLRAALPPVSPPTVVSPPSAPRAVTASSSTFGEATVSWTAPESDGGGPTTSYRVTTSPPTATTTVLHPTATVTGLTPGVSYTFSVVAVNEWTSPPADSAPVVIGEEAPVEPAPVNLVDPAVSKFSDPRLKKLCGLTTGPDGALWFGNEDSIGRITTAGVVSIYPLPNMSSACGITTGPDGALWFTSVHENSEAIVRYTIAGSISIYKHPSLADPTSLTSGPDGALWFVDRWGDFIGRVSTSGVITTYSSPNILPWGTITSGADGALWFGGCGKVGRITTVGVISSYSDPRIACVTSITSGSDGALWFTDRHDHVGRMTTGGVVTNVYYSGDSEVGARGIVADPDGALWYLHGDDSVIAGITTGGDWAGGYPQNRIVAKSLAIGPDGALWFLSFGNWIGRMEVLKDRASASSLQGGSDHPTTSVPTATVVADARVAASNPSTNYGGETTIRAKGGSSPNNSYLKFDVSGLSGPVTSAKLRLKVTDGSATGGSISPVADTAWDEGGITYDNAPVISPTVLSSAGAMSSGQTVDFDLGNVISGDGTYGFALTSNDGSDSVSYASLQSTTAPELVITTETSSSSPSTGTADRSSTFAASPTTEVTAAPVANFKASLTDAGAGQAVVFTDTSTGVPTFWSWNFGDGTTSSAQHPTHAYTAPGTYTVTLTVSNELGTDTAITEVGPLQGASP